MATYKESENIYRQITKRVKEIAISKTGSKYVKHGQEDNNNKTTNDITQIKTIGSERSLVPVPIPSAMRRSCTMSMIIVGTSGKLETAEVIAFSPYDFLETAEKFESSDI